MKSKKINLEWKIAYAYIIFGVIMLIFYLITHNYELAVFSELLFIIIYFLHSILYRNIKYTLKFFAISYIIALLIEEIGLHTGIPFGHYYYTSILGPALYGVPYAIPFLWSSLLYFSMIAANNNYLKGALLMMFLDLSFDPRFSMHLWHWITPGIYFGVPVINFFGWFISSLIILYLIKYILKLKKVYSFNGIIFYFLLGIFQGIEDSVVGLFYLSVISFVIFSFIFYFELINYKNYGKSKKNFIHKELNNNNE